MDRIFKYTWRQDNDHNDYINQIKQKQQNKLNKQKSNKNSFNWRGESNQHSKYLSETNKVFKQHKTVFRPSRLKLRKDNHKNTISRDLFGSC